MRVIMRQKNGMTSVVVEREVNGHVFRDVDFVDLSKESVVPVVERLANGLQMSLLFPAPDQGSVSEPKGGKTK